MCVCSLVMAGEDRVGDTYRHKDCSWTMQSVDPTLQPGEKKIQLSHRLTGTLIESLYQPHKNPYQFYNLVCLLRSGKMYNKSGSL